jgi:hypothetical protein
MVVADRPLMAAADVGVGIEPFCAFYTTKPDDDKFGSERNVGSDSIFSQYGRSRCDSKTKAAVAIRGRTRRDRTHCR